MCAMRSCLYKRLAFTNAKNPYDASHQFPMWQRVELFSAVFKADPAELQAGREAEKTLGPYSQNGCTGYKEGDDHSVRFSLVLEGKHERHAAFVCKLEVHFSILGADRGAHAVYVYARDPIAVHYICSVGFVVQPQPGIH